MEGTVKWFDDVKGYGFISTDDGSGDVFVHYGDIRNSKKKRRSLDEGQGVVFEVEETQKGKRAINVTML